MAIKAVTGLDNSWHPKSSAVFMASSPGVITSESHDKGTYLDPILHSAFGTGGHGLRVLANCGRSD